MIRVPLTRKEAQALTRVPPGHSKGCKYYSPFLPGPGGRRCTCGWVSARKKIQRYLRGNS